MRPSISVFAIGCEDIAVCFGAFSFSSYDAMLDHCRDAWNWVLDQHWRIMFIGFRSCACRF
jgi:hypothetical protein